MSTSYHRNANATQSSSSRVDPLDPQSALFSMVLSWYTMANRGPRAGGRVGMIDGIGQKIFKKAWKPGKSSFSSRGEASMRLCDDEAEFAAYIKLQQQQAFLESRKHFDDAIDRLKREKLPDDAKYADSQRDSIFDREYSDRPTRLPTRQPDQDQREAPKLIAKHGAKDLGGTIHRQHTQASGQASKSQGSHLQSPEVSYPSRERKQSVNSKYATSVQESRRTAPPMYVRDEDRRERKQSTNSKYTTSVQEPRRPAPPVYVRDEDSREARGGPQDERFQRYQSRSPDSSERVRRSEKPKRQQPPREDEFRSRQPRREQQARSKTMPAEMSERQSQQRPRKSETWTPQSSGANQTNSKPVPAQTPKPLLLVVEAWFRCHQGMDSLKGKEAEDVTEGIKTLGCRLFGEEVFTWGGRCRSETHLVLGSESSGSAWVDVDSDFLVAIACVGFRNAGDYDQERICRDDGCKLFGTKTFQGLIRDAERPVPEG